MKKYFFIIILVLSIIFVSGCVQQSLSVRGIDLSMKSDDASVFAGKDTTLYVDVENKDEHPYWKVFVDVFDPGMFKPQRIEPMSGVIGEVRVLLPKNCTSSAECYDEDYGGCGVCIKSGNDPIGQCTLSQREQSEGMSCDKTCQCAPNQNLGCKSSVCKKLVDSKGNLTCRGGTPYNKCGGFSTDGTQSYFCDEFGTSYSQCQGPDEIIGNQNTEIGRIEAKDNCGCPEARQCRGDGTCGQQAECFMTVYNILPSQIRTLVCKLGAPQSNEIPKPTISSDVNVRMRFSNKFSAPQTIEMISEDEYKLREFSGKIQTKPSSYTYKDKTIEVDVEFSKPLPIIVRKEEKVYMYITVKDISDGSVYPIRPNDFSIIQSGTVVSKCDNQEPPIVLRPDGKTFPRITCELNLPPEINYLSNYVAIINIDYSYEYRKTISIEIMK